MTAFPKFSSLQRRLLTFGSFSDFYYEKARLGFFLQKAQNFYLCCNFCDWQERFSENMENCMCTRSVSQQKFIENLNTFKLLPHLRLEHLAKRGNFLQTTISYKLVCYYCGFSHYTFPGSNFETPVPHYNGKSACPLAKYKSLQGFPTCTDCNANKRDCAFLPCGHVLYCIVCACSRDKCETCNVKIADFLPIFF
jgi:hypothetical protein